MNQVLKDRVYGRGSKRQVRFLADLAGMTEEETTVFLLLHDGKTETAIKLECCLSAKSYKRIEESIQAKLLLGVFECINFSMDNMPLA